MTKTKAGPIVADRLKSFLERIEKLIEERAAIGSDIRDIFAEAKGVGYDVKTMRKLVQLRAMDAADRAEAETLLNTYAHAIGLDIASMPREPSEDELMEQAAKIVAEVDRCMELVRDGNKPPKIDSIRQLLACSTGKAHKVRVLVEKRMAEYFSRTKPADRENENPETADRKPPGDSSERDGEGSSSGAAVATFAAPETCVDGESVHLQAADSIVPRRTNPQTEGASTPSVTPVPEEGEGTGTIEPGRARVAAESERPAPAPESCGGGEVADPHSQPCAGGETRGESRIDTAAESPQAGLAPGPQDPWTPPPFLDRRKVAA